MIVKCTPLQAQPFHSVLDGDLSFKIRLHDRNKFGRIDRLRPPELYPASLCCRNPFALTLLDYAQSGCYRAYGQQAVRFRCPGCKCHLSRKCDRDVRTRSGHGRGFGLYAGEPRTRPHRFRRLGRGPCFPYPIRTERQRLFRHDDHFDR